jgi:hypothetical protein
MTDPSSQDAPYARWTAVFLILSGVFFTLFPAVRPFFDESSLSGAAGFASARWVVAHAFGMAGLVSLVLGFLGLYLRLRSSGQERRPFLALVLTWVGAGLTLPFFGAEAFSLHVIGRAALDENNAALLPMVNKVRFGPGIYFVVSGLLLIAAGAVILATAVWRSGVLPKWSGVPLAVGFAAFLPSLQGAPLFQPLRIAIGVVIWAGCVWLAAGLAGRGRRGP